jgi:hypothetical protein
MHGRLSVAIAAGSLTLLGGCMAVSADERKELAAWEGCIDGAIADRRDGSGRFRTDGRTVFFEVTHQCRALFPDWDQPGKTKRGQKLLDRLYNKLGIYGGPSKPTEK